jgi:hypothetical protein
MSNCQVDDYKRPKVDAVQLDLKEKWYQVKPDPGHTERVLMHLIRMTEQDKEMTLEDKKTAFQHLWGEVWRVRLQGMTKPPPLSSWFVGCR